MDDHKSGISTLSIILIIVVAMLGLAIIIVVIVFVIIYGRKGMAKQHSDSLLCVNTGTVNNRKYVLL